MAKAPTYTRQHQFDALSPSNYPGAGQDLDNEFDTLASRVNQTRDNLALVQRDDGALRNAAATWDALSSAVKTAIQAGRWTPRGNWLTGATYVYLDMVYDPTTQRIYVCPSGRNHVASATFAADLAAGRWMALDNGATNADIASLIAAIAPTVPYTGDASAGTRIAANGERARTFAQAASDIIWLQDFDGVDTTNSADSSSAIGRFFNKVKETRKEGRLPSGRIRMSQKVIWDFASARDGATIRGPGGNALVLDFTTAPNGTQFEWRAPLGSDAFDWDIGGFRIEMGTTTAGAVAALLGRLDGGGLAMDAFNGFKLDLTFGNGTGSDNIVLQMNGWYGCDFKLQAAGPNTANGIAFDWNYFAFNSGKLFPGGRKYGVRLGQYVFGNEFTACDFEILQTCIISRLDSNASRNSFSGQFVWGANTGVPATEGQNGATPFADLPSLGGPLFIAPGSNFSSGGVPNPTGAAASLLRAMHTNYGDWEAGGLAIYRPVGKPARLLLDTETGQISVIYHYRGNSLRWTEYRDTGAESGGTARLNSALVFEARDDAGNNPIAVLTLLRDGRVQVLGGANGFVVQGAPSGSDVAISAVGTDANITARLAGKGNGAARLDGNVIVGNAGRNLGFFDSAGTGRATLPGAASDPATTQALVNAIRSEMIAKGFCL